MVEIEVKGWVAEGGGRLLHFPEGDFILFDLVENDSECGGFEDEYGTNQPWFHCCLEIKGGDPSKAGVVPEGYKLFSLSADGFVMFDPTSGSRWRYEFPCLRPDQVIDFIEEGELFTVEGEELLLKGEDGKIMRVVVVQYMYFLAIGVPNVPHTLKVPYRSDRYFIRELKSSNL